MENPFSKRLLLTLVLAGGLSLTAIGQTVTFNVSNVSVQKAMNKFHRQTGYTFVFAADDVDVSRVVSVHGNKAKLSNVINQIFDGQNVSYTVEGKRIVIKPQPQQLKPTAKPSTPNQGSTKKIKGRVVDEKGEPIVGATVKVKGSSEGTITDIDGNYSLTVPSNGTIEISYVGFTTQQLSIGNKQQHDITLYEDNKVLNEVVVVGYGSQKKINLTGSVASVDYKKLSDRPVTDASQALEGAMPGLQIMQGSGQPGEESFSYNIRGIGTLNSSSPLVLVDGMEQSISSVNPSDIESVSVLKDAASCAIYGNRGANGVILVTTKSGAEGKTHISYDGTFSYNTPSKVIHTVSNTAQYMRLYNESMTNVGQSAQYPEETIKQWEEASEDPNGIAASGYPNYVAYPNTDWWDVIYSKKWMQRHSISVDGRDNHTGYSLSLSYTKNPGLMKSTGYERYQGRVNLYTDITNWLRIGTRTSGMITHREMSNQSYNTGGFFGTIETQKLIPSTYPYYDGKYGAPEAPQDDPQSHNALWDNLVNGFDKTTNIHTNWYATVKFLKHFQFTSNLYYYYNNRERKVVDTSVGKYSFSKGAWSSGANEPSTLYTRMQYYRTSDYKLNHLLNYTQSFGKHDISALIGFEAEKYQYRQTLSTKLGLTDPGIDDLDAAADPYSISGYGTEWSSQSLFGRLNYAYANKYLFEFDLRHDGSSRFAKGKRWGTFPSASAAWRITEENFMQPVTWLSNLKLRLSYGRLGNNSIGNYEWQQFYSTANYFNGSNQNSGIAITALANQNLTWEKTDVLDLGFDFGILKDKLSGTVDFYNKKTSGILYRPDVYMVMGLVTSPLENIAEVNNKGLEFQLTWQDHIRDFNYSVTGNFSWNRNRVTKLKGELERGWDADHKNYTSNIGEVSTGSSTRVLEGHMINEWYMPNVYKGTGKYFNADGSVDINGGPKDGMIRTTDDMKWLKAMKDAGYSFQPFNSITKRGLWYGEYIYADANGDGIYGNSYDSEFQGCSSMPKYNFALSASAEWKGFDFSMTWGGSAGNKLYYYRLASNSSNTIFGYAIPDKIAKDHYFFDPDNPDDSRTNLTSKNPRLTGVSNSQSSATSSLHLENGAFLKLRNLTFGYTIPKYITTKFYVEKLRVFFSGENLLCITGFSGLDPEMRTADGYATMRQFAFGVNVTF